MLFDARKALAKLRAEGPGRAIRATRAIPGGPNSTDSTNSTGAGLGAEIASSAEDAENLAAYLRFYGPASYGAAASDLRWSPSRAWRAEAELQAAGRITHDRLGFMVLADGEVQP